MYYYYVKFYEFLQKYERFKYSTLSFNQLKQKIGRIQKWFDSEECMGLDDSHQASAAFWTQIPTEYHTFDTILDV